MSTRGLRDIDRGWDAFVRDMRRLASMRVDVGIMADEPADLRTIAATHEYGTHRAGRTNSVHIPERSYLRATFDERVDDYRRRLRAAIQRGGRGEWPTSDGIRRALGLLGLEMERDIRERIESRIDPPLAPSTVARRGRRTDSSGRPANAVFSGTTPLINTGRLIASIRHVVSVGRRKGGRPRDAQGRFISAS